MFDLKVCTVCLQMNVKCYNMNVNNGQLRKDYNAIAGLETRSGNGLPEYLCYQCTAYMQSCKRFRDKCQRAYFVLQEILQKNKEITKSIINELDCDALNISPTLSFLDKDSVKTKFDKVKFKWIKTVRMNIEPQGDIPVIQYGPQSDQLAFEQQKPLLKTKIKDEIDCIDITNQNSDTELDTTVKVNVFDNNFESHEDNDYDIDIDIDDNEIEPKIDIDMDTDEIKPKVDIDIDINEIEPKFDTDADGSNLDQEYAKLIPINMKEASAVAEICKSAMTGQYMCSVCQKRYCNIERLDIHMRMHEKHLSGTYQCFLCKYYYKTEFLLKTHMTDKHMYKYLCRKCPQVTFDRPSAKHHFLLYHIQKKNTAPGRQKFRPKWLRARSVKKVKKYSGLVKKSPKVPKDFLTYTPISQEEQYALVRERQNTKNYTESQYTCEQCFKGFREVGTFSKHMQKHDPAVSGKFQCDMCKIYFPNTRKMYKHMNCTHLFKYTCKMCSFVCYNKCQAQMHYKFHKNVTYPCPHCDLKFNKLSTCLTHVRVKHPSTFICALCGHSFVSEYGLACHKKLAHTKQEVEEGAGAVDETLYCSECGIQFRDDAAFTTHFGSSNKHSHTNVSSKPVRMKSEKSRGRPRRRGANSTAIVNNGVPTATNCDICQKLLVSDTDVRRHYEAEHPGADYLKRYMCDICGHTTRQYANLTVHMRTHTQEKPYACPHCERRFSMPSNRDRHLVVHTGEKRYQCQHCNRRFTQSSAVKLHIQTVHLKIPYAPWDKKNRKRRRELEVAPLPPPPPAQKIILDAGNYLSAYITYNE